MTELSLFEPMVLTGVVEHLTAPESLTLMSSLPRRPSLETTAQWDVIKGSRKVAKPNVPNSEAHIVPRLGRAKMTANYIYLREKKVFEPTTIRWIRAIGSKDGRANAEREVLREVTDLNQRFDNFLEFICWRALEGTLVLDYPGVQATIDFGIPASHKVSPATSWASATTAQIMNDIRAWKRLIRRDGRVDPTDAYLTEFTVGRLLNAFAGTPLLMSDRMKDEFYRSGVMPGFMGLDWNTIEQVYDTDDDERTLFLPDDRIIIANLDANRAMEVIEGPSADDEAPQDHTGKFSKTWKEPDPSDRQFLLEWNVMPVITQPEQIVVVNDVAP